MRRMKLKERIKRWSASHGHGVHSPLAFRLIEHVVRPPRSVVYYGEERLKAMPDLAGIQLRRARMLLRLTAELQPSRVWLSPKASQSLEESVRFAGEVIRIFDGKIYPNEAESADLIVFDGGKANFKLLNRLVEAEKNVIAFGWKPRELNKVESLMKGGVLLNGVESFIMINRQGEELHKYNISKF